MKTIASNNLKRNNRVLLPESSLTPALLIRKRYIFIAAHRGLWRLISRLIIRWRGSEQSTTRSDRRDPLLARIDANISRSQSRPLLSSHQLVLLLRFYARLDEDIELLFFIALLRTRITRMASRTESSAKRNPHTLQPFLLVSCNVKMTRSFLRLSVFFVSRVSINLASLLAYTFYWIIPRIIIINISSNDE